MTQSTVQSAETATVSDVAMEQTARTAAFPLLIVAGVHVLHAAVAAALVHGAGLSSWLYVLIAALLLPLAGVYYGLYRWTRRRPFSGSFTGLVLYVLLHAPFIEMEPTDSNTYALLLVIKIGSVVILWHGFRAGLRYRRMERQREAAIAAAGQGEPAV